MTRQFAILMAVAFLTLPGMAVAQDPLAAAGDSGDTAWLMACAVLLLLAALPGLGLFYGGRVEGRNFLSVTMQLLSLAAAVSLTWIVAGYTLAFGEVNNGFIGDGSRWMMIVLEPVRVGTMAAESAFALFQMACAVLAVCLVTGAWTGRGRMGWAVIFTALWVLAVYAPLVHWTRGGGWLEAAGVMDFAGGLTVHVAAGMSALVIALLMGQRKDPQGAAQFPELSMIGGMLLFVGWFGLVGGSALAATDDASTALINLMAAASAGALAWLALEHFVTKAAAGPALFGTGALAGLVAITPAAGFVSPGAAIVIGALAALAGRSAANIAARWGVDDAMDVFAVHAVGGTVGLLLTGIFASPYLGGTGYAQDGMAILGQMSVQAFAIAVAVLFSAVVTALLALGVSFFIPMRVSQADETVGMDVANERG